MKNLFPEPEFLDEHGENGCDEHGGDRGESPGNGGVPDRDHDFPLRVAPITLFSELSRKMHAGKVMESKRDAVSGVSRGDPDGGSWCLCGAPQGYEGSADERLPFLTI